MPDIHVTDDQRERLEALRGEMQETFIDTYGHIRLEDAVEYLLDSYGVDGGLAVPPSLSGEAIEPPTGGETSDERRNDSGDANDADDSDADDGASRLNAMMNLLDAHGDKWREATSGDEKYEVDLPDGTTENVRTKDDVRALLFRHYR